MSSVFKIVLFTDEVKSTANMARRSPNQILQVEREHRELTSELVGRCHGNILKDTGDGYCIEFFSCADAVRCGHLLQERLRERNHAQSNDRLRFELRVGIDAGEVEVLANGDVRGDAANRAARICAVCPAGEVYLSEKVRGELREAEVSKADSVALKGVPGKFVLYRLVRWLGELEPARNPFVWRQVIVEADAFFDRKRELDMVRAFLNKRQNSQIVGPKRIGKSSLLRQIERLAPQWQQRTVIAYADLQKPHCFTLAGWLRLTSQAFGWSQQPRDLIEYSECVDNMVAAGDFPVLCLDEFRELILRPKEFARDFFLTLRACGQAGMSIITASTQPLSDLTDPKDSAVSPFYNTFPLIRLGPLADADAAEYVSAHRPGVPMLSEAERMAIVQFAKGHPLALQIACFRVLEARENKESVTMAMQKAADDMKVQLPAGW